MKPIANTRHPRFVLRPYRRVAAWYDSYYLSENVIGKGIVKNLSRMGLRMLGDHALLPGSHVCIRLMLNDGEPPLEISRAIVRWTDLCEFGLRIEQLTPHAAHRLANLIKADLTLRPQNVR
ncbi:MAG TPA: PilZ domain-containing protein [Nitrospira sp.]|nr:PilZ domain-containing protein [Nitrospira sp.]